MRFIIFILFIAVLGLSMASKNEGPDLTKKDDLKSLGIGRIVEKDRSVITRIILEEITEYAVVYIKDESLHDIAIEQISKIEFKETKWGPLKIEFPENKPRITLLND